MTAVDTPLFWSVRRDMARAEGAAIVRRGLRLEVCWCGALYGEDCRTRSGRVTRHKGRRT